MAKELALEGAGAPGTSRTLLETVLRTRENPHQHRLTQKPQQNEAHREIRARMVSHFLCVNQSGWRGEVAESQQVLLGTPTLDADVFNPGGCGMCMGVARSTPFVDGPPQKIDNKVITASCL